SVELISMSCLKMSCAIWRVAASSIWADAEMAKQMRNANDDKNLVRFNLDLLGSGKSKKTLADGGVSVQTATPERKFRRSTLVRQDFLFKAFIWLDIYQFFIE